MKYYFRAEKVHYRNKNHQKCDIKAKIISGKTFSFQRLSFKICNFNHLWYWNYKHFRKVRSILKMQQYNYSKYLRSVIFVLKSFSYKKFKKHQILSALFYIR